MKRFWQWITGVQAREAHKARVNAMLDAYNAAARARILSSPYNPFGLPWDWFEQVKAANPQVDWSDAP